MESSKRINQSFILVRNFNISVLWISNIWSDLGLAKFVLHYLKYYKKQSFECQQQDYSNPFWLLERWNFRKILFLFSANGFDFSEHFSLYSGYYFLELVKKDK